MHMTAADESKGRIRDLRGRLVTQLDPVMLHVLHRYHVIDEDALHTIVEDLEPGTARIRRHLLLIIPCAIVGFIVLIALMYAVGDASARKDLISTITNPVIMGPNVLFCVLIPWITARQARLKRVRFALLKHHRCPHCGYSLYGLPTDSTDRATVCPECGCAWLLDDRLNAEQLAATAPRGIGAGGRRKTAVMLVLVALMLLAFLAAGLFALR